LIIAINSLLGFVGDLLNYQMEWRFLLTMTTLAALGILIGNSLQKNISSLALRKSFGWFILAMGLAIFVTEFVSSIQGDHIFN
jgi:uncharacterized membrane protein YfcA